ncbi:iron-hydroxamate ABC transporter substrate-binding protein [Cohnella massiliensis]|uniref:iron-hydroxamate ABC transporter substrate-binding protein n=1 Tax=Cohnella massiliensis TaxID=1816691 RepID=UPI001FE5B859|nr:iron-hydroxamate ABC transporter substrate-binding protein [Cohnella massiliensis]
MSHAKKKIGWIATSLIALSLMLAACGGGNSNNAAGSPSASAGASPSAEQTASPSASAAASTDASAERTLTDGLGNEVTVPANPERIIASYLEDHLVALGVKPVAQWSVANGIQDYLQGELEGIPTIAFDLPYEAVASFTPDLIIVGSSGLVEGDKYGQYSKIAPTFVLGDEINNDWRQALLKIGEVLGKSDEAQKALDDYDAKAKDAKEKLQQAVASESAAVLWLTNKQFYVVSESQSSGAVLYGDLGLTVPEVVKEISAAGSASWNSISLEKLAELDADHIFLINSDVASGSEALQDPIWQSIPAVKNGNVYEFDSKESWLYSGAIANGQMIDNVLASLVN